MRPTRTNTGGILPGQIDRITRRHRLEHEQSIEEAVAAAKAEVVTSINTGAGKPPITGSVTMTGTGGTNVGNSGSTVTIDTTELTTLIQQIINGDITTMSGVPKGVVAFWSGTVDTIPAGWAKLGGVDGAFLKMGSTVNLSPTNPGHITIPKDAITTEPPDGQTCIQIQEGSGTTVNAATTTHVHKLPNADYDLGAVPDPSNVTLIPIIKL